MKRKDLLAAVGKRVKCRQGDTYGRASNFSYDWFEGTLLEVGDGEHKVRLDEPRLAFSNEDGTMTFTSREILEVIGVGSVD